MNISKKQIVALILLITLCVWGVLIYSNTLTAPFVFDDETFVLRNPAIKHIGDGAIWKDPNYRKRIVTFFSFALNYRFNGIDAFGYHAVNLAIHFLAALSVVWFVLLLFQTPRMREEKISAHKKVVAFLCGWMFLSHPIQTEAVSYISQRFESLGALFYLMAVCFYIKGRISEKRLLKSLVLFPLSVASAVFGMLTKETVFTLPFALVLIEWLFLKAPSGERAAERMGFGGKHWIHIGGIFLTLTLLVPLLSLDLRRVWSEHARMGIPAGKYFLTQFRVIMKYFELLFLPLNQNIDYDFPLSAGLFDVTTFFCALGVLGMLLLGFKSIRRFPLIGFGILWFFLTLSITSTVIPLKDVIFEHRLYLPSVGFVIAICVGLYYLTKNFRFFVLSLSSIILIFSFLTYQRNAVWADEIRLWEDAVKKSPNKARPYVNLGKAYRKSGKPQKAVGCYLKALELYREKDKNPLAQIYVNLGAAYGDQQKYQDEIDSCLKAIELNPKNPQAYSNLAFAYSIAGDYERALTYGYKAVKVAPRFDEGWNNLGVVCGKMGQYTKAAAFFEKALSVNPHYREAQTNLNLAHGLIKKKFSSPPLSQDTKRLPEQNGH